MIKCLAIDDDPLFLKLLKSYINDFKDIELIASYENPIDGVMAVVKQKPDILLIDIDMPYMDGFETLETLDSKPKIIIISGHLNDPTLPDLTADKFISKRALKDPQILENAIWSVINS